jgi:hypothetical protein
MSKRRTDNVMSKRRTDNVMSKRRTDNVMSKRRTDNVMSKRKRKKDKHLSTRQYTNQILSNKNINFKLTEIY